MTGFRIVRITRTAADDRIFDSATEAQDEAVRLWRAESSPGVDYTVAHESYPLAKETEE